MNLTEEKKKLIRRRGMVKASLTKFMTFLDNCNENTNKIDILTRLDKITDSLDKFTNIQLEINDIEDIDDCEELEEFEDMYYRTVSLAKQLIQDNSDSSECSVSPNGSNNQNVNIKLPALELPSFEGDYQGWYKFKETFEAVINKNSSIPSIQKFHYLNSALRGNAKEVISSIEVSSNNYCLAWDLLTKRFENEKLIINSHLKSLFELPNIVKENHMVMRKLVDDLLKHIGALGALGQPVNTWDTILIYLIASKLDPITRKAWESSLNTQGLPTLAELVEFLNNKARILETVANTRTPQERTARTCTSVSSAQDCVCTICKGSHLIYYCKELLSLSVPDRIGKIKQLNLCLNCLRRGHRAYQCKSFKCTICKGPHNKLLHRSATEASSQRSTTVGMDFADNSRIAVHCRNMDGQVLLSTANIFLRRENGSLITGRAILDVGSDANFITKDLYQKLGIIRSETIKISVAGIGFTSSNIDTKTYVEISSTNTSFKTKLPFLVIDRITENIPLVRIDLQDVEIPEHIELADPQFNIPGKIDVLLGAEIFYELLSIGKISLGRNLPTLRNSKLGWLMTGKVDKKNEIKNVVCNLARNDCHEDDKLHSALENFWKIEECPEENLYSREELECEKEFVENVRKAEDGRFVVQLPLKVDCKLGESRNNAEKRLINLEKRLEGNMEMKDMYHNFMDEYINLGHMEKLEAGELEKEDLIYYIPHHSVIKESSSTTRLRVVFDASAKSSNNRSLNGILKTGPCIQDDLFSILIRFRKHKIVIVSDIEKMFRQIWIDERTQDLQRILWRKSANEPVETYRLKTVTYGTAPASFLATRCLKQVAIEQREKFPKASATIQSDFYMDDLVTGAENDEDAIQLKREVSDILCQVGFNLRKWCSNRPEVLGGNNNQLAHFLREDNDSKTLGIHWEAREDTLSYDVVYKSISFNESITKRTILAFIAQIFDPLGLIAPIVISGKILLQDLWSKKLGWDEEVPDDIQAKWSDLKRNFSELNDVRISRWVLCDDYVDVQVHGFSDASEKAFGAAVYVRSTNTLGVHSVHLLCAKSRVAPLKTCSVPRLELCAALLLVKLVQAVTRAIKININGYYYWTDSSIVLNWINGEPNKYKTFVGNRIAKIQMLSDAKRWRHVSGKDNPADIVSRGANVELLKQSNWFRGPCWLPTKSKDWPPTLNIDKVEIEEIRTKQVALTVVPEFDIFERYSSLQKLVHVIAWCNRFIYNCSQKSEKRIGKLSNDEIDLSLMQLIRIVQSQGFHKEIEKLKVSKNITSCSNILALNPVLDDKNILRVGGRIDNSDYSFEKKHPIILPKSHVLTKLIIKQEHERLLHAGCQSVLASIRELYWPLSGKDAVKGVLRKCITCFRNKPKMLNAQMGDLPSLRLHSVRPFTKSALDYAGPILIKDGQLKNRKLIKSYLCIFVCFVSKAVHIEVVTDLSSKAFLNALKRFVSRRGIVSEIQTDNGTNFVGASRTLREVYESLVQSFNDEDVIRYLCTNKINWKFCAARSPHLNGLAEAAVKSAKYHLKRVLGNNNLTYEQMYTLTCQIESVLNSRPLIPSSNDPCDYSVLTPGHFIIGSSLAALPQENVIDTSTHKLDVYLRLQQILQHFWARWSKEYICTLQERNKWKRRQVPKISIGDLVLMKEENLPPLNWKLARVTSLHPGKDGVVRVVGLKTPNIETTRSIHNVAVIPLD